MPSHPRRRLSDIGRELRAIATHDLKGDRSAAKEVFIKWTGGSSDYANRRRWVVGLMAAQSLVVSLVIGLSAASKTDYSDSDWNSPYTPTASADPALPGTESRRVLDQRVLPLPPQPGSSGAHRFAGTLPNGEPLKYDPCRPLFVILHSPDAPRNAIPVVREALKSATAASGLALWPSQGGHLVAYPKDGRFRPYDKREAVVHVVWSTSSGGVQDTGHRGLSTSAAFGYTQAEMHYNGGTLPLDRAAFVKVDGSPQPRSVSRAHVLHQVGHLLGLRDVNDPTQLMHYPPRPGVDQYRDGDLTGLRALSQGACYPTYP